MTVHEAALKWLQKQSRSKDIAMYRAMQKPNRSEKEIEDIEDAIEAIDYLLHVVEGANIGEWYKEQLPMPDNAKNKNMEHFRLVCPFCGRRNGKKRDNFCPECGAIMK